ncbi:hypothetical protein BG004_004263, partial [Podila humilis]
MASSVGGRRSPPSPSTTTPTATTTQGPPRALSPEEIIAQTNLLDDLMSDIGMGKFQKQLL